MTRTNLSEKLNEAFSQIERVRNRMNQIEAQASGTFKKADEAFFSLTNSINELRELIARQARGLNEIEKKLELIRARGGGQYG